MKTYLAKLICSPRRYTMGLEEIPEFLKEKKKDIFSKAKLDLSQHVLLPLGGIQLRPSRWWILRKRKI